MLNNQPLRAFPTYEIRLWKKTLECTKIRVGTLLYGHESLQVVQGDF